MMTPEQIAAMRAAKPNHYGQRLPTIDELQATIIAQAAEIARLTEMLTVQWEGIPWRDGPPPAEWRDGREVLVWTSGPIIVLVDGRSGWWTGEGWVYDEEITHHAAITAPEVK